MKEDDSNQMSTRLLNLSTKFVAVTVLFLTGNTASYSETLKIDKSRPVWNAVRYLENEYGWLITYEESSYYVNLDHPDVVPSNPDGPKSANETSVRYLGKRPNGGGLLIPSEKHLEVTFEDPHGLGDDNDKERILNAIVQASSAEGTGYFKVLHEGNYWHIVPTSTRDESGRLQPYVSLLDTKVSLPQKDRSLGEAVHEVLKQIGSARGVTIGEGMIPTNMFISRRDDSEVHDEPARDVLDELFETAGRSGAAPDSPTLFRVTWTINFDPGGNQFVFNAHGLVTTPQALTKQTHVTR